MKKVKVDELTIEGVVYVPKDSQTKLAVSCDGLPYVMIRTHSAGVHCGFMEKKEGKEVTLLNSIRIWKWEGAASLSQLSQEGTNKPSGCKFGMAIQKIELTEAIEVIYMTDMAQASIQNVASWKQ